MHYMITRLIMFLLNKFENIAISIRPERVHQTYIGPGLHVKPVQFYYLVPNVSVIECV